jgi:hypothetical protein
MPPGADLSRLVVKLRDGSGAEVQERRLRASRSGDTWLVETLLDAIPGVVVEPVIGVESSRLEGLRHKGEAALGERLADLSQLFHVTLPDPEQGQFVLEQLLSLDVVENVYAQPAPTPAGDILLPTPDFRASQGYRAAAPAGIDAGFAAGQPGGLGGGVTVADLEFAWNLNHEDLSIAGPGALLGPTWSPANLSTDHGTAVIGVLVADQDPAASPPPGIEGICTGSNLRVVATQTAAGINVAGAIVLVAANLQAGDVLLIELQQCGPNAGANQFGSLPMEYFDAEYYAIRQATALGIHVVEAAGNGSQHLDS